MTTLDEMNLSWQERAACIGKSDLFFNDHMSTVVRKAKLICETCVVRVKCLEHAMSHQEFGIWGGMTANERRLARRKRNKTIQ